MYLLKFEKITVETLYIALEIVNSNSEYNQIENGFEKRSMEDIEKEFLNSKTESLLIKADDTYIGIMDYLDENPQDGYPWLGLLMIHHDYQSYGYGRSAYERFEKELKRKNVTSIRLGVLEKNEKAHRFWQSLGFSYYTTKDDNQDRQVACYEKLIQDHVE